jgi:hypothetical protein
VRVKRTPWKIKKRASYSGENVDSRQKSGGNVAVIQLTDRQTNIVSLLLKKEDITAKQVAVIMDVPLRTIERNPNSSPKLGEVLEEGRGM